MDNCKNNDNNNDNNNINHETIRININNNTTFKNCIHCIRNIKTMDKKMINSNEKYTDFDYKVYTDMDVNYVTNKLMQFLINILP